VPGDKTIKFRSAEEFGVFSRETQLYGPTGLRFGVISYAAPRKF
jgi:hypothetical protein